MKKRDLVIGIAAAIGAGVVVKMLTRAKTVNWDDISDAVVHSNHSGFVNVDGARVHFQEFGDRSGQPVILIHGYSASVYVWREVGPMLASAGFRVIAIDLLGFGYSEKPRWFDYSITSQARMIARFMDRIGLGKAALVGSSYGGAVAATLALDYPERVEKLALVGAVCNDRVKNHPILRLASIPGIGEAIAPFLADTRAFHRHRMRLTLAKENRHLITEERVESVARPLSAADAHHSLLATTRNWHADRITHDAHLINHPTLLLWGENDSVIPVRDAYTLHDEILHSRLVIFKKCGHVPMEEKTELFADIVTEFVRDRKGNVSNGYGDEAEVTR